MARWLAGSSPRGRGTRLWQDQGAEGCRFIPAWAGNTIIRSRCVPMTPVHPRVGGEHASEGATGTIDRGSSPRGRGTPILAQRSIHDRRFIPAWAGNTWVRTGSPHTGRFIPAWAGNTDLHQVCIGQRLVHPRVGGEHVVEIIGHAGEIGSSPRGRGTLATRFQLIRHLPRDNQDENAATIKVRIDARWHGVGRSP